MHEGPGVSVGRAERLPGSRRRVRAAAVAADPPSDAAARAKRAGRVRRSLDSEALQEVRMSVGGREREVQREVHRFGQEALPEEGEGVPLGAGRGPLRRGRRAARDLRGGAGPGRAERLARPTRPAASKSERPRRGFSEVTLSPFIPLSSELLCSTLSVYGA